MIRALERAVTSNRFLESLLFNEATGAVGDYVAAARRHRQYDEYRDRYDVHPDFRFNGPGITLYGDGAIELGEDSYIGRHSRIQSKAGNTVRIGDNTAVSHYVFCYTQNRVADQDMSVALNRNEHLSVREGDVEIGDDCWIGAFTFVTEGSSIGDNTVVGANAVVTDDLPPHCIAAGAPARVRRFKSYLDGDSAAELARDYRTVLGDGLAAAFDEAKP